MGEFTKIEWSDHTFNPWHGCFQVSPACDFCYAKSLSNKNGHSIWGKDAQRRMLSDDNWRKPLLWNRKAKADGVRHSVFSGSMCDVFEPRADLDPLRARLWQLIEDTPHLDWLLLTKRPGNILKLMPEAGFPDNVWLGTTVDDQLWAKGRIKQLLRAPASVHFLSCEPLLGPLDLSEWLPKLDWVIAGGETGPNSRPTDPAWYRSIRDQCVDADVAFHFKQWGDWTEVLPDKSSQVRSMESGTWVYRAGKKLAGRELDGRTWDERPPS